LFFGDKLQITKVEKKLPYYRCNVDYDVVILVEIFSLSAERTMSKTSKTVTTVPEKGKRLELAVAVLVRVT